MNKFNASFTGPDVFHLDNEFVVPVEMMKANLYPLSWFTLESQDIQVGISRALQVFIGISSCCGILTNCKHSLQKTQIFFSTGIAHKNLIIILCPCFQQEC